MEGEKEIAAWAGARAIASAGAALGIGKVLSSESDSRVSERERESKQDDRPATGVAEALELSVITIR